MKFTESVLRKNKDITHSKAPCNIPIADTCISPGPNSTNLLRRR